MRSFKPIPKGSINSKLVRVFLAQILAISIATIVGVYGAALVVENVLVREALKGEAEHFWEFHGRDMTFPLPHTNNLRGYLAPNGDVSTVPPYLADLDPGFQRIATGDGANPVVHVTEQDGHRLFLVFDEVQVSNLAFYFGIAPLTAVLLVIYMLAWLGYVLSRRAVSAVVQLAEAVRTFDFKTGDFQKLKLQEFSDTTDDEVLALINALEQFTNRLERFVARERNFTRNASHELRTPLAVLKGNVELLQKFPDSPKNGDVIQRIDRTLRDMESLVETLLILARESESKLSWSSVVLNDLLAEQLDQVSRAVPKDNVSTAIHANGLLETQAPERVLGIIFHNLIRNAMTFTDAGQVTVEINEHGVSVRDTGCGMSESDLERAFEPFYRAHDRSNEGYGLGLAIVNRLCLRFGWPLEADSELGSGTVFRVSFPKAKHTPLKSNRTTDPEPVM
ncbi:MAG: HAMP domain-containing sensor histidine kinase [Pseudomonadota bacterium]